MTETENPPPASPQSGVDREHLRNYERLTRSTTDRKVAGVAGGLGRHLNIDPTILRVLFVVLCFFGGAGFLLYGAAWLLVPEDGRAEATIGTRPETRNGLLIAVGVLAALVVLGHSFNGFDGYWFPWPVALVGVGVLVYLASRGNRTGHASTASTAPVHGPPTAEQARVAGGAGDDRTPPWLATPQPAPAPPRRRGPLLFGPTLALVAIALGALGLFQAAGGTVALGAYAALALAVVGIMLVVGAFVGRPGGLVLLGLVAALALAVTSVAGSFSGARFGDGRMTRMTPTSAAEVRDTYRPSAGPAVLDLSQVRDPGALDGRTIHVDGSAGNLVVVLPDGVTSNVEASIDGPGQVDLPDRGAGGFDTDLSGSYGSGSSTFDLDASMSVGHILVRSN